MAPAQRSPDAATREDGQVVRLTVNGARVELRVDPAEPLCDVLRERLRLTGTKAGCRIGVCGLCTVLVDDLPASSCLLLAPMVEGRRVTTIEGLAGDARWSALLDAFVEEQGFQCGICTPAQVLAASALLAREPDADEGRIREWLTGNLCRCTGYASIVRSVLAAARAAPAPHEAGETPG